MGTRISQLTSAAALAGTEQVPLAQLSPTVTYTGTTVSANGTTKTFYSASASWVSLGFTQGKPVKVTGFANGGNNITSGVLTAVSSTELTISSDLGGSTITDESAGASVTITQWETRRVPVTTLGAAVGGVTQSFVIACTGEDETLVAGTGKVTFRMPYGFTLTAVRASLNTAQTSGSVVTVDVNEGGTSLLSTKLTFDNGEKTTTTAATGAVLSDTVLADDAEITVDIDQVGDGTARGLKIALIGVPAVALDSLVVPVTDETTAITAGTAKITFRMPSAFTLTGIRASLTTAQTSGSIFTVDVNEGGVSILSTKLTIDNTERTTTTAATAAVLSDTYLADDAEITVDVDQIGDGTAKGLKLTLLGYRAVTGGSAGTTSGTKTLDRFTAMTSQPPLADFATLDTRNSIAVLDFDAATQESAFWVSVMPEGAVLTSGLRVRLHWMATSATSGDVVWGVQLERMNTDLDADSFDTAATATGTANGTSGILTVTEITLTTIDSVVAGEPYRLLVYRKAADGADTMTGDAELVAVEVRSVA